jgi:hypothetical protein
MPPEVLEPVQVVQNVTYDHAKVEPHYDVVHLGFVAV